MSYIEGMICDECETFASFRDNEHDGWISFQTVGTDDPSKHLCRQCIKKVALP